MKFLLALSFVLLFVSCSTSDDVEDDNTVHMPVTLIIPASDQPPTTRVGDPGTYEQFKLPQYAYIYIICKSLAGEDVVVRSTPQLDGSWTKTQYTGAMAANGDSVYQYNGNIEVRLPVGRTATGKVYVALSTVPLSGLPTGNEGFLTTGETEETVRNYQFTLNDETRAELANIYSTPYNYRPDGVTYYGTMNDINTLTPSIEIVLYHVAAKLDLLWNVDESIQQTTAISKIKLSLPNASSCYIFRPLDNLQTSYASDSILTTKGTQWYGRDYKYIIPVASTDGTYSFDAELTTTNGERNTTVSAGTINRSQPFTPWMRGNITVRN